MIENLSAGLTSARSLINDRNIQVKNLSRAVKNHELTIDILEEELHCVRQQTDKEHEMHEAEIADLVTQIKQLQEKSTLSTFSSRTYTTNVRELYYSLLSLRLPPAQIKTVVRNVLCHLLPSLETDALRLPGKACASYMRSQEMPTISQVQKASELMQEQEWHLNSDGTTLMQQKKAAFLINGIVLGVHDIPDGSSQVCLDALKAELAKTSKIAAELSCSEKDFNIDHIVSSTSDSASTQTKFTHLLEDEIGKPIVENKCSMHLGVNLRVAQVKAAARIGIHDASNAELESAVDMAECSNDDCDDSVHTKNYDDDDSDNDGDSENDFMVEPGKSLNRDIDLFVHELAKLFGHLGSPEYCHGGSTFRIFLAHKAQVSTGDEKEYYESAQKIVLECQVGSHYFVTSCNAGRLYFLHEAMVAFLKEQRLIKALNCLKSSYLQKLHDPLLLAN